jgi:hypothetical protein
VEEGEKTFSLETKLLKDFPSFPYKNISSKMKRFKKLVTLVKQGCRIHNESIIRGGGGIKI